MAAADQTPPATSSRRVDVAVVGGGSAAEALVRELAPSGASITVFEDGYVGGTCPFTACMPSKSMLHDAAAGRSWDEAVARRDRITEGRDDHEHAAELERAGAELVRSRARVTGVASVATDDAVVEADHIVLASGSSPVMPDTEGDAEWWTSDDALVADEQPHRVVVLGGGPVGCELAQMFAAFGSTVDLVAEEQALFPDLDPEVGRVLSESLRCHGVALHLGRTATRADRNGSGAVTVLDDGTRLDADRLIAAIGRRPRLGDLGLDALGLDPDEPLPVEQTGRVACAGSVWAIGDVAGFGQYTHVANHHARVVAANLRGGDRRFDEVAVPGCVFTDPPVVVVGPTRTDLAGDDDVVWASRPLDVTARALTDEVDGFLSVAARRSTGTIVAAHGIGPRLDELIHALTIAIDGAVPLATLARSLQPFPTLGEVMSPIFAELAERVALTADASRAR